MFKYGDKCLYGHTKVRVIGTANLFNETYFIVEFANGLPKKSPEGLSFKAFLVQKESLVLDNEPDIITNDLINQALDYGAGC